MAREFFVNRATGQTVYVALRVHTDKRGVGEGGNLGKWWNTATLAWEYFTAANWANYATVLLELGTTGFHEGTMPAGVDPEDAIEVYYLQRVGAAAAMGDTKIRAALFERIDEWVETRTIVV